MNLDRRAFDLLCAGVACVLLAHAPHLPWWFTIAFGALLLLRWAQRRTGRRAVPKPACIALVIALPAAVLALYGTPFGRAPGTALAVGMLVLKLLESESERDARMAVGFCCFVLMSSLLFGQSLWVTAWVAISLLPLLATLRALEPDADARDYHRAFVSAAGLLLAAAPLALLAFAFVPRLATPLWGAPGADIARTGISDRMTMEGMRDLLIDDSVAMRIGFSGTPPAPAQRYFRGITLSYFDGRTWRRGVADLRERPPAPLEASGPPLEYDVELEPTRRPWLFALDVPLAAPLDATLAADRTLTRGRPVDTTLRYRLQSATVYRLHPQALPPALHDEALELPRGFDPRSHALAAQWRARYGNDDTAIVRAALSMFRDQGFVYDLAAPPLGRNSVDDFLFGTREGFCEHYAGAFTFLMRAAGIPTRVVAGYAGGYWNPYAQYLLLRQSDAHAWAEVWLAGRGWVRVDPTAMVRRVRDVGALAGAGGGAGGWLVGWRDRLDIVNRLWNESVVGFDALRQSRLLQPIGVTRADWGLLATVLGAGTGAILLIGMLLALHRSRSPARDALEAAQWRLQAKLAHVGLARRPGEGPRDFFARCIDALPERQDELAALARAYMALRYGWNEPPAEPQRNYSRAVRSFRAPRVVK